MAKPIFLVGLPRKALQDFEDTQKRLEQELTDYHVIVYMRNNEETEFRAFYEKDFDEVKFEQLKEIVRGSVTS